MAMSEGTVTINPSTGAVSGSGAAREVFDAMDAGQDYGDLSGSQLAGAKEQIANLARAVAKIIPHIQANAVVPAGISVDTGAPGGPATDEAGSVQ